jgi:small subunit ribosomal protein S7e
LYFSAALQIEVPGGEQAIVLMVPFRLLKDYQEIHKRLVRELEKKFSGSHVVIIGERKMYAPNVTRRKNFKGPRPRSRTLTSAAASKALRLTGATGTGTAATGARRRCSTR